MLVTRNMTPGESVYGEKRISVETTVTNNANAINGEVAPATKTEYRVWNPFRSKICMSTNLRIVIFEDADRK